MNFDDRTRLGYDVDGFHVWLKVGTDNFDDYYPIFAFHYSPKEP